MPTILILDDATGDRQRVAKLLTAASYTVREAGTDWEGLHQLREGSIDLVLVSLLTLTHDGLASLQRQLQQTPSTKLIAMARTDLSNGLAVLLAAEVLNVHKIFPKPVDPGVILGVIRREVPLPVTATASN